jgi:phosphoglycerate dehydrogenase-like enzyme
VPSQHLKGDSGRRLKGLYIIDKATFELVYGPKEQRNVAEMVDIFAPPQTRESIAEHPELLAEVEVILTGWGAPRMDHAFLAHAPKLQAVFYGAGSIRGFVTDAVWERGILITSAAAANAVPVADYTLSVILLSLKHFWRYTALVKRGEGWGDHTRPLPGGFQRTVGLISLGTVGCLLAERLRPFDLRVIAYDPFSNDGDAEMFSLDEVFRVSDVVSLHTPQLEETMGMITGRHFASMKQGATFINTARGAIVREAEMLEVLRRRPDLTAVLDVTDPEPPTANSPLLQLPNVVVTPHIAGSMGTEIRRLGRYMVEELHRYVSAKPLRWCITPEQARLRA